MIVVRSKRSESKMEFIYTARQLQIYTVVVMRTAV